MSTATQKVFLPAIFTCSHITFAMVYSFYFLCFDPRRNEFNLLFVKESTYSSGRYIFRANRSLLISPPLLSPKDYWIYPFRSQNTEKRNNAIFQMRLRSGFKMRISILNPATTEQMGYGIISFFVCFLSTNLMSYIIIKGCDSCFICSDSYYIFYIIKEDLTIAVLASVKCFLCGFYN